MSRSRRSSRPSDRDNTSEPFPTSSVTPGTVPNSQDGSYFQASSTTTTTQIGGNGAPTTTTTSRGPPGSGTPGITITSDNPNDIPFTRTQVTVPSQSTRVRQRPIGIRRLPSANRLSAGESELGRSGSGRSRSSSAPLEPHLNPNSGADRGSKRLTRGNTRQSDLPTVTEGVAQSQRASGVSDQGGEYLGVPADGGLQVQTTSGVVRRRSVSDAARSIVSKFSDKGDNEYDPHAYEADIVDYLDVIDPEVSALTTLTNVQNSLFVPDLGRWLNRRPTYTLSQAPTYSQKPSTPRVERMPTLQSQTTPGLSDIDEEHKPSDDAPSRQTSMQRTWSFQRRPAPERSHSISSVMTESHYAVLPHGIDLEGWTEEDKEDLDDYVRHMLHSKRSKFKQSMRAFGKYLSKPLGFLVTLYAVLITLFGLAWVLFLIGWINVGDRKSYLVNVIDNVLVALFAVVGDGLAPFRAVDTYHMAFIAHYHKLSWRLRRERGLPKLRDHNDMPEKLEKDADADPEAPQQFENEYSVLTPKQQKRLIHHQTKFAKSHSFYKPHETATHHAFPLKLLITVVTLLDAHSILQIMLGSFTWGWSYHTRPTWITTVILCFSITVNITAGVFISIGDRKTRKKDVILRMTRQEMTRQAIKHVNKHKEVRSTNVQNRAEEENFEVIREETGEGSARPSAEGSGNNTDAEGQFVTPMTS